MTLTSTLDRRQTACPGEVVTYICNVTEAGRLEWTAVPFINNNNRLQFTPTTRSEDRVLSCAPSTVQCADFDYQATLTSVGPAQNGFADMTSTFRFTASARVNGTVVECRVTTTTILMESSTLIATGTAIFVGGHAVSCFIVKNSDTTCSLSSHINYLVVTFIR